MNKNLLIGFGSEVLADQSIVPKLIDSFKAIFLNDIDFVNELISSLDLITLFEHYDSLLILDTIQDKNSELGKMDFFSIDDYKPGLHLENYHDSSITETLEVAHKLGVAMPKKIGIITINVRYVFTISKDCCPGLTQKYPELLQQLIKLMKKFFLLSVVKEFY